SAGYSTDILPGGAAQQDTVFDGVVIPARDQRGERDAHNLRKSCCRDRSILDRQISIYATRVRVVAVNRDVVRAVQLDDTAPRWRRARHRYAVSRRANQNRGV